MKRIPSPRLLLSAWLLLGFAFATVGLRAQDASPSTAHVRAIGQMRQAPIMDGTLDDWPASAMTILLGRAEDRVLRPGTWNGVQDSSAAIRLAWDADYLYFAADVSDDKLLQAAGPAEIWQGDSLELFFNIHPQQQRTEGFWQLAVVPQLAPDGEFQVVCPQKDFEGVEGTTQIHDGGYTLECRIPWRNFSGFSPVDGANLGFQVFLDDRDSRGRKSQLVWYPSAITYSHPTDTGTLILRSAADTATPQVVGGAATASVTDTRRLRVSVLADVAGTRAIITPVALDPAGTGTLPAPITVDLQRVGERLQTGRGELNIEGLDGRLTYTIAVTDAADRITGTYVGAVDLVGPSYASMRALEASIAKRLDALAHPANDAETLAQAGLQGWLKRHRAFIANEARSECLTRPLLDRMQTELSNLDAALTEAEAGRDPYTGRQGSMVQAYRSPLTGEPRAHALIVPPSYREDETRRYPMIVLLHRIFADERYLASLTETFSDLDVLVYQAASYRQFDWGGVSAAETWAGLEEVQRRYRVDPDHVVLVGYHNGGRGVWQLAMARPDLWSALAPIFSGIDSRPEYPALSLYPERFDEAVRNKIPFPSFRTPERPAPVADPVTRALYTQSSLVPRLDSIRNLPIRSVYGEDDPGAAAERLVMEDRLRELGARFTTRYAPGAMHGSTPAEIEDPDFYRALLAYRRPDTPRELTFVTPGLRDNAAWWVRVDGQRSSAALSRVDARNDAASITVTTSNISALTLSPDAQLVAAPGDALAVSIDGKAAGSLTPTSPATPVSFVRDSAGNWSTGELPSSAKRHGLSGPINDFQFARFLFVYGTGGDTGEQTRLATLGKKLSNWGLGAEFACKPDLEVTEADLQTSHLLLIGTPKTNSLLAKLETKLPLRWTDTGLQLGEDIVAGPDAGACLIYPNPLAPTRYVVVITATSEAGYKIWSERAPGGDYVLGRVNPDDTKAGFHVTTRGWFDSQWQYDAALRLRTPATAPDASHAH